MDDALKRFQQSAEDLRRLTALSWKNVRESAELLERLRALGSSALMTRPAGHRKDDHDPRPTDCLQPMDADQVYIRALRLIRQSRLEALQLEGDLFDIVDRIHASRRMLAESRQLLGTVRTPIASIGRMGTRPDRHPL